MISLFLNAVRSKYGANTDTRTMNHNRIFRVLNVLFLSCGYQVQWFNVNSRKFQLSVVGFFYFICLALWYAICFQQHFTDSSIFYILQELAPILHKCIRLHLFIGIKVMVFALYEMRHVTAALNVLIKALPTNSCHSWSWNEIVAYIWIFSGLLINFGFGMYIMVQLEFKLPTLQQAMHFTAMFLPHFALASSFKLLNVTIWIARAELQQIHSEVNEVFNQGNHEEKISSGYQKENNNANSVELSVIPKQPNGVEGVFGRTLILSKQLEELVNATQNINTILQKQIMLLLSMNSVCLLGATYSIVNYKTAWHLILEGPLGRSLLAFNSGVFVFICWDYICLSVANYFLEIKKLAFIDEIETIRRKLMPVKDTKTLLKDMRYMLKTKLKMQIFFNSPITWQTISLVNTLIGMAIAIFMIYSYLRDQIDNLHMNFEDD